MRTNKPPKKYLSKADAHAKLQRYCAYQDRCHKEVRSKLLELGVYGDELEEIIVQLIEDKFLDEERYARSFARGKFRMKQWGRLRIERELKLRHVSDYCIRKALEEIGESEYYQALEVFLRKKSSLVVSANEFEQKAKLAQYAMRKGFEPDLIWEAIKKLE